MINSDLMPDIAEHDVVVSIIVDITGTSYPVGGSAARKVAGPESLSSVQIRNVYRVWELV